MVARPTAPKATATATNGKKAGGRDPNEKITVFDGVLYDNSRTEVDLKTGKTTTIVDIIRQTIKYSAAELGLASAEEVGDGFLMCDGTDGEMFTLSPEARTEFAMAQLAKDLGYDKVALEGNALVGIDADGNTTTISAKDIESHQRSAEAPNIKDFSRPFDPFKLPSPPDFGAKLGLAARKPSGMER